jgi:hypothetical protein
MMTTTTMFWSPEPEDDDLDRPGRTVIIALADPASIDYGRITDHTPNASSS